MSRSILTSVRSALLLPVLALGLAQAALAQDTIPQIPETPARVLDVVSIQPYALETPARHMWRAERPVLDTGYLLVLKVDSDFVFPRQIAEPVLYVGRQTAERLNVGYRSGYVVAMVPAVTDPTVEGYMDLTRERIWFGSPELPERVDVKRIVREERAAIAAGIRPFAKKKIEAARKRGGQLNAQKDKRTLMVDALQRLVLTYSPEERELVEAIVLPGNK